MKELRKEKFYLFRDVLTAIYFAENKAVSEFPYAVAEKGILTQNQSYGLSPKYFIQD